MELPVSLKLSSIYCWDEADGIGNAEPYLWIIFFKIDGENISQNGALLSGEASFRLGIGSHGNLNTHAVDPGESIIIPAELGEWTTTLKPIIITDLSQKQHFVPGILGIAVILMEEDNVSDSGAETGHIALNQFIEKSINDFIKSVNLLDFLNDAENILDDKIEELKKDIIKNAGNVIEDAITNKQPWYSDLWSGINADDKIGSKIWFFDQYEIVSKGYHIKLAERWENEGDWEIFGFVDALNPCQSQLNAVDHQNKIIKSIEDNIRKLQDEFRLAPAWQKPSIKAEIEELKREQLRPAQNQLKPLMNDLDKCYGIQRVRLDIQQFF